MPSAAATVVGDAALTNHFGLDADEASLVTQSVKIAHKRDKKEARDKFGNVISVAYYNRMADVEIVGLGTTDLDVGDTATLNNVAVPAVVGSLIVDEVTLDYTNEDYVKSTIKASAYENIVIVAP